jgi:hypothetical protein
MRLDRGTSPKILSKSDHTPVSECLLEESLSLVGQEEPRYTIMLLDTVLDTGRLSLNTYHIQVYDNLIDFYPSSYPEGMKLMIIIPSSFLYKASKYRNHKHI